MNSFVVGIDVGEEKSDACYLSPAGDTLDQFNFQMTDTGWSEFAPKIPKETRVTFKASCLPYVGSNKFAELGYSDATVAHPKELAWIINSKMKNNQTLFGYKSHILTDLSPIPIIESYATTTASVHDSQVDLSRSGVPVYRDKGYFGVRPKGFDATMTRALRGFSLSAYSVNRNKRISRKRPLVEHPFAIIKRVIHFSHTLVALSRRVGVKVMLACLAYNLFALRINLNKG